MTEKPVPLVYLDTNAIAYAFEGEADIALHMQNLLKRLKERPGAAATSELTLAELTAPDRAQNPAIKRRLYFNLLIAGRFISLLPVTREVLVETADLRQVARMKLPDAIHVVTAMKAGCKLLLSNDRRLRGKVPEEMALMRPDQGGIHSIMKALA